MKTSSGRLLGLNSFVRFSCFALCFSAFVIIPAKAETDPQIVRVSYMQGDVRFSRGHGNKPDLAAPWELAVRNLPILQGFSVATGANGRAEIEFESGTTLYMAENSVLLFQKLETEDGVPATKIELATGLITVMSLPIPNETFELDTPGTNAKFLQPCIMRVDSYLNTTGYTYEDEGRSHVTGWYGEGASSLWTDANAIGGSDAGRPGPPPDWDNWVKARIYVRRSDTAAALKASGLTAFVPGLTDLYRGGTFFSCPPYGTCWKPKQPSEPANSVVGNQPSSEAQPSPPAGAANVSDGTLRPAAFRVGPQETNASTSGAPSAQAQPQGATSNPQKPAKHKKVRAHPAKKLPANGAIYNSPGYSEDSVFIGCVQDLSIYDNTIIDPFTGDEYALEYASDGSSTAWPLCHSGSWIPLSENSQQGSTTQFTFVVGKKRFQPPVRWLRTPRGIGYVPIHPRDVEGKPPLNLKYGVFEPKNGSNGPFHRVDFNPKAKYAVPKEAPAEFRDAPFSQLIKTDRPIIYGRQAMGNSSNALAAYDYKTRNFVRPGEAVGGRPGRPTVVASFGTHGKFSGRDFGDGYSGGGGGGRFAGRESGDGGGGRFREPDDGSSRVGSWGSRGNDGAPGGGGGNRGGGGGYEGGGGGNRGRSGGGDGGGGDRGGGSGGDRGGGNNGGGGGGGYRGGGGGDRGGGGNEGGGGGGGGDRGGGNNGGGGYSGGGGGDRGSGGGDRGGGGNEGGGGGGGDRGGGGHPGH